MHFSAFEGFLSASFHASADGRRVFNYAQWRSRQAWEEALPRGAEIDDATPGTETDEAIRKVIVTYGAKPIRADILRVARVVETSRST